MKNHDLVDIDCLLRFYPKSGKSVAIAEDETGLLKDPIFLPMSEIEIFDTGRTEAGKRIITVTMPQWLAEENGLV